MLQDADDKEPVTRRVLGGTPAGSTDLSPPATRSAERGSFAYCVEIAYREPTYALYSGTEKTYGSTFQVWAADDRAAIAEAKARFEDAAASSGVGWGRVIVGIVCRVV
jgi:hypothetical protein